MKNHWHTRQKERGEESAVELATRIAIRYAEIVMEKIRSGEFLEIEGHDDEPRPAVKEAVKELISEEIARDAKRKEAK
jgi:hypothetical protein